MPDSIPAPGGDLAVRPDKETAKGLADMATASIAEGRVFHLNLGVIKYGVNDKAHAASLFLSLMLLVILTVIIVIGLWATNKDSIDKAVALLASAFTFTAGIAIGRGGNDKSG